jgi:hypothetical protein
VSWLDQQPPPTGDHGLVIGCGLGDDDERPVSRPWPVSRRELGGFTAAGLGETEFSDQPAIPPHGRFITAVYTRPAGQTRRAGGCPGGRPSPGG